MSVPGEPVPLSLITGFLGSGKTTLLNRLLKSPQLTNTAVIINEFGDVGLDHLLVEAGDEGIIELSDGCLCCTVRGDLVDTLGRLLERRQQGQGMIDRLIVETTGLADPAPILHVVMAHPVLQQDIRLDGVVCVVDAVNGEATLDAHVEAVKQVAVADRIVLSKGDLVEGSSTSLMARLKRLNPGAGLIEARDGDADPSRLMHCGLYNPETRSVDVQNWLREEAFAAAQTSHHHHHHDVNRHDASIRAFSLTSDQPIASQSLDLFLDLLRSMHGPNLLRVKGIVCVADHTDRPVVIHGVQQVFHPPVTLARWPDADHRSRIVMITRDLSHDFVQKLFDAFAGVAKTDTPDLAAMADNPLAIPGGAFRP